MATHRKHLPYGSRRLRAAQKLGFVFNDDGTWGAMRLKTAKGEAAIAKERLDYPRSNSQD